MERAETPGRGTVRDARTLLPRRARARPEVGHRAGFGLRLSADTRLGHGTTFEIAARATPSVPGLTPPIASLLALSTTLLPG